MITSGRFSPDHYSLCVCGRSLLKVQMSAHDVELPPVHSQNRRARFPERSEQFFDPARVGMTSELQKIVQLSHQVKRGAAFAVTRLKDLPN